MPINHDDLRRRILNDLPYTREEIREAINDLRGNRIAAGVKATEKRQAAKGMSDAELDDDFMSAIAEVKAKEVK